MTTSSSALLKEWYTYALKSSKSEYTATPLCPGIYRHECSCHSLVSQAQSFFN